MSYDLYFYKRKEAALSEDQIERYLTERLVVNQPGSNQWFFENFDTDVYYSFEKNNPEDDPEALELYENFPGFDNTYFSFSLYFLRPSFFALEAFQFVEIFLKDLDLFVLNLQGDCDYPVKADRQALFENWNRTNLLAAAEQFNEQQHIYFPLDRSNETWEYNFNKRVFQQRLGQEYFVPRVYFLKTKADNRIITLSTWTQHIANVFPPADYYLLIREYRKIFRMVQDNVLIDRETLLKSFDHYFGEFNFEGCKIIHPSNSHKVKNKFNTIESALRLEDFAERIPVENLFNAKPGE